MYLEEWPLSFKNMKNNLFWKKNILYQIFYPYLTSKHFFEEEKCGGKNVKLKLYLQFSIKWVYFSK